MKRLIQKDVEGSLTIQALNPNGHLTNLNYFLLIGLLSNWETHFSCI
jgi:hypothetical protein